MLFFSVKSKEKVIHYEECPHLRNIKKENLCSFDNIKDARNTGYRICSCCSPVLKLIKNEENKMDKFCLENGLSYYIDNGDLGIKTFRSEWKIIASDNRDTVELHHKNSFKKEHDDSLTGYHKQNYAANSIMGYMRYISEHDCFRMHNPIMVYVEKEQPHKGSKRWKKQQEAARKRVRRYEIKKVLDLIENLSVGT